MARPSSAARPRTSTGARSVVFACLAITLIDGLDSGMYGAVLPTLLQSEQWGITLASAGVIGSLSLIGMMLGALLSGYVADIIGRRPTVLACVASFSVFTLLCSIAPNLEVFGLLRLLAGFGFGGALPTVIALTMEYVPLDKRQFYNGVVQTGFPIGGCLVAFLAIFLLPSSGWASLFVLGGVIGLVLFAVVYRRIPESLAFLSSRGRHDEARRLAERYGVEVPAEPAAGPATVKPSWTASLKLLFAPGFRVATLLFPVISFCGLLLGYGMNTWIPQLLRASGYDLGSALTFLVAFYLGSTIGMLVLAGLADRWGPRPVISAGFVCGALAVAFLTLHPPQAVVFAMVLVVGFCSSSQTAVAGFVGIYYPAAARGTALGAAVGLGRLGAVFGPILVGLIMGSSLGTSWVFYFFAFAAVAAALLVILVPRTGLSDRPAVAEPQEVPSAA
ncbi:MFS transporter [Streptomyces viridosporus]|uniref:MFS transporter n=1 Tax=Streptomyces viridosporus TaxID=67581 RepID=UPI0009BD5413|nr:MFS transporter [Streptomyces viridosporus]